jgi:hypothetical protein
MELASICRRAHTGLEGTAILSRSRGRDRWFESTFVQRRVRVSEGPGRRGSKSPGFARVCATGLAARSAETRRCSSRSPESPLISLSGHIPVPQCR